METLFEYYYETSKLTWHWMWARVAHLEVVSRSALRAFFTVEGWVVSFYEINVKPRLKLYSNTILKVASLNDTRCERESLICGCVSLSVFAFFPADESWLSSWSGRRDSHLSICSRWINTVLKPTVDKHWRGNWGRHGGCWEGSRTRSSTGR